MKKTILSLLIVFITINSNAQTSVKNIPKCGRYNIHLVNNCHWLLASKSRWIMGYVLVSDGNVQCFDINGNEINQKAIIGYKNIPKHKKQYNHENI